MYAVGGDKPPRAKERPAWLKPAVCEDYRKGMTMEQVARKYHVSDKLVSQYIHGCSGACTKFRVGCTGNVRSTTGKCPMSSSLPRFLAAM